MRRTDTDADAVVSIGGGVHGVHLAVRLLQADLVDPCELRIVDPSGLLESFRRKCRQCGMVEFRSPFVHHVGTDPFSLRAFAQARGREDELIPGTVGAERPTASLFFEHAESLCERYDLESVRVEARVTDIVDRWNGVEIQTTNGPVRSRDGYFRRIQHASRPFRFDENFYSAMHFIPIWAAFSAIGCILVVHWRQRSTR